jgi:hypothetical protein
MSEKLHRRDIQKMIYEEMGITPDMVIPTYRDKIDKTFTIEELRELSEDAMEYYFDMGHSISLDG